MESVALSNKVEYSRKMLDFQDSPMKCGTSSARFPEAVEIGEVYRYGRNGRFKTYNPGLGPMVYTETRHYEENISRHLSQD